MKLYQTLESQLKKEPNYVSDNGELKKWVVINKAQNFDEELIALLLEDKTIKDYFFKEIVGVTVFNQALFLQFLEQKNYLNDSYTQFKNKVGLTIDGKYLKQRNEVALVWPFKDCILEGGQSREEDKREEIFFNEILAQDEITQLLEPKVLTNAKRFDKDGEKPLDQFNRNEEGTITDNLIIKGNNLLALHTLKQEFAGKVKLIYIDPPYNTGNDGFKYNDNFNHSTWLTFMKNRLTIARELLREDGIIFIQCDDNEQAYLKVLMDEVFRRENFISDIITRATPNARDYGLIAQMHEHIILYAKNIHSASTNPIEIEGKSFNYEDNKGKFNIHPLYNSNVAFNINNRKNLYYQFYVNPHKLDDNGFYEISLENKENWVEVYPPKSVKDNVQFVWRWGIEKAKENLNIDIVGHKTKGCEFRIVQKMRGTSQLARSIWNDTEFSNRRGTEDLQKLFGKKIFSYPKSENLLERIIKISTQENDIVLDYHLGSGTTASTAHKMNRQYIGIEQMDYIETVAVERLKKVIEGEQGGISKSVNWQGGGSFVYLELRKYNQTFIEQIKKSKNTEELLGIWEQMKSKSFLSYNVDIQKQEEHIEAFKVLTLTEQKQHLCELLDKNQLYVNRSSLEDEMFECTEEEKRLNQDFYETK